MKRLALLALVIALAGCGPSGEPPKPNKPLEIPHQKSEAKAVKSEYQDNQGRGWNLSVTKAKVEFTSQVGQAEFEKFSGDFFDQGKKVGFIQAASGSADTSTGIVKGVGGVDFRSYVHNTEIKADTIEWRSRRNLIIASNAEVKRKEFTLGPVPAMYADTSVGTIWVDNREGKLNLASLALPLILHLQIGDVSFDYATVNAKLVDKNTWSVVVKGTPAHVVSKQQGIDVTAARMDVTLVRNEKSGEWIITNSTASGGLKFSFLHLGESEDQRIQAVSGSCDHGVYTFDGKEKVLRLIEKVVLTMQHQDVQDPGVRSQSDEAVVRLDPKTNQLIAFDLNSGNANLTPKIKPKKDGGA